MSHYAKLQIMQRTQNGNFSLNIYPKTLCLNFFLFSFTKETNLETKSKLEYTYKNEYNYLTKQYDLRFGPEMVFKTENVTSK